MMQLQDNITPRYKQKFSTGSVLPGEGEGNSVEQHELLHILQTTRTIPHPIDQESMICHSRNQLVPLFEHESIVGFHLSYFRRHWYLVYVLHVRCPYVTKHSLVAIVVLRTGAAAERCSTIDYMIV